MSNPRIRRVIICMAVASLLTPQPRVMSAETKTSVPAKAKNSSGKDMPVTDIALSAKGTLRGQVMNEAGQPVSGIKVVVTQGITVVASTSSNNDGRFELNNLPGGVFQLTADRASQTCRLWTEQTAPPAAGRQVMLVHDQGAVRGQSKYRYLSNPIIIAGIVAAAVAIPVAIHAIQTGRNKSGS